ncbi:DNA circularization protein [Ralstonia pseudosolanacearum]|uniref:DNA circularization protein n=1 Tax=Ralstonia pseudosolanacearum TaxID=1310165 RepID=UPI003CE7452F
MASWRDQLRPASFRGVPFQVDVTKRPIGRRVVTHEYPGKNLPYVEDMGRVTREHKITGFVIGDDYMSKRDALLTAVETEGMGELVHPWLGTLKVTGGVGEETHSYAEGGMVRFDLTFIESGELTNPAPTVNTAKAAQAAGAKLAEGGLTRFERAMAAVNTAQVTVSQLSKTASGVFDAMKQYASPITSAIGTWQNLANLILTAPGELTSLLRGVLAGSGGAFHLFDGYGGSLASLFGKADAASSVGQLPPPQGEAAGAVHGAVVQLARDLLIADAIKEVGEMPIAPPPAPLPSVPAVDVQVLQPITRPDAPIADDVLDVRDQIVEVIWQQAQVAPLGHYQLLTDARIQASRHLAAVARPAVRLATVELGQSVPALVLAYARYGDATRADEVVTRNRIQHPGFLPVTPLQVAMK